MEKSILFTGLEHRVRRRETVLNPPEGVRFVTLHPVAKMRKDYLLSNVKKEKGILRNAFSFRRVFTSNNIIPKKVLKGIDLIYSPGYLVLNRFPFVVEVDNVAVLAYYKLGLLRTLKPIIKIVLKSHYCKRIICISEAAKKSVVNYFKDEKIGKKCSVVYPYIKERKSLRKSTGKVKFLFISSNFYLKGGKEVVNAFNDVNKNLKDAAELTIITKISDIDEKMVKKIRASGNIRLVESNLSKEELFRRYYLKSDVFVIPSYQDSFGMVCLEALSAGLPIIATDMFAFPEVVVDGKNGFLCHSPIPYFRKDFLPNPEWWEKDKAKYAKNHRFPEIEKFLAEKMKLLITDGKLREKMGNESRNLLKSKFSDSIRKRRLGEILVNASKCAE